MQLLSLSLFDIFIFYNPQKIEQIIKNYYVW